MTYVAAGLLLIGSLLSAVAALGILRFPDVYTRLHAASKAGVVGAGMVLCAVAITSSEGSVVLRAVLGVIFLLLTTPVSAHLLAKAALHSGLKPTPLTKFNELP